MRRWRKTAASESESPLRAGLEGRLGYVFADGELLRQALAHRSWEAMRGGGPGNERLEFLGDAVLQLRVSERLLQASPGAREGELTRRRAAMVSAKALARVAQGLQLGECLLVSPGEEAAGGRSNPRLLANALEAVIAAIHHDGGYAAAAGVIDRLVIEPHLRGAGGDALLQFGAKSALQEWAHAHARALPEYRLLEASGPEHNKQFLIEVRVGGAALGTGRAHSKKEAEQAAAAAALTALGQAPD